MVAQPPALPRAPLAAGFVGAGRRLTPQDLADAAGRLGCALPLIAAVLAVESSGSGFDAAGRPKILFEPHVFYRQLMGRPDTLASAERAGLAYQHQGEQPYPPTSEANYSRLKRACLLDPDAAMKSASWGIAQVMGYNYVIGGYASVSAMVGACMDSEAAQFGLLLGYVEHNNLVNTLRTRDFRTFARVYNGPGAVAVYAAKLQAAWLRSSASETAQPFARPSETQQTRGSIPAAGTAWPSAPAVVATASALPAPVTADSLMDDEWLRIRSGTLTPAANPPGFGEQA